MNPEPPYTHGSHGRIGVLLVNLGTPDAPSAPAVRSYLAQFLSDTRVIEIPSLLWKPVLHLFVLRTRPAASARRYARIWTPEGSPLKIHTERQAALLQGSLGEAVKPQPVVVEPAMRYGRPAIADAFRRLCERGVNRLLVLPLYPQYSASTTASAWDALFDAVRVTRNPPELRLVKHFHDHPGYIAALADRLRRHWNEHGRGEVLVMSFHGVPRFTLDKGDPYHCECQKTGRLLAEALALPPERYRVTFQSRFGRAEWLKPYTSDALRELGAAGVKRLDVVCPGFVSDCLETLEEIALEGRDLFRAAGGGDYRYVPSLNHGDDWIRVLVDITREHLDGWLTGDDTAARTRSRERALALGAKQ